MNDPLQTLKQKLEQHDYIADPSLLMAIHISEILEQPLFLEGEPGVGKTEVAKVLANILNGKLIRVQCFPGIESNEVLYEWNYLKQMLHIRMRSESHSDLAKNALISDGDIFSREFLTPRPLLSALLQETPVVLLIDEIDRADERFEAFLLEFLSDFQISIPELGTIEAKQKPRVVLTSNRTRDVHDALRRRCVYQWIDYPTIDREMDIIRKKTAGLSVKLLQQISAFMAVVRKKSFDKKPGLSESLDWAKTLISLGLESIFDSSIQNTFSCLFKTKDDLDLSVRILDELFKETKQLMSRFSE